MDNKNFWSKALPYLVAVVCFAALSGLYFAPQFAGKDLRMADIVHYEGSSKDIDDHIAQYDEDPQWTGNSFSGMPATLISIRYPGQVLKHIFPIFEFMGRPAAFIFIAMLAFFVMLLLFGMKPWVALVPALAYGLSTYFFIIIDVGHITKMISLAYAPLVVGAVYYTLRRNMWLGSALSALFASLLIAASHPQIAYYFAFIIAALWVNELVRAVRKKILPRFAKATGLLVVAAILALGSNYAPLWYITEYSKDSIRGGSELVQSEGEHLRNKGVDLNYATQWSYGIGETFNMYIPYLYGGSSEGNFADDGPVANSLVKYGAHRIATQLPSYWGKQPVTSGPTYIGAVVIFLAVLAMFMLPRRKTLWLVIISLIAIMLAWGHNFMWFTKLFFYYFPGYDKFRTVAMILVIVEWTMPFLGALAISKLWRCAATDGKLTLSVANQANGGGTAFSGISKGQLFNALKYTVAILGGISLFFLLFGGMIYDFVSPSDARLGVPEDVLAAMREERASMMRADALRSLVFMLLGAGAVLLYGLRKIKRGVLIALLMVLVCVDLVVVDLRFLPQDKFIEKNNEPRIKPTAIDLQILQDDEPGYRVFNLAVGDPFSDATTSYFHRSIGGYSGAKMQRYQDIIERYLASVNIGVLNMLNTKYIISLDRETQQPFVMVNPDANGSAWFVDHITLAATPDQEIAMLGAIDNKHEAVVDERFGQMLTVTTTADSTSYINLTDYRPNYMKYEYYSSDDTYAIFSEIYYDKGWTAYIDGQPSEYFRANYILRGIGLPAGEHTVEFRYRAKNFNNISNITLIFSLLIIVSLIAAIVVTGVHCSKNKRKNAGEQETAE